MNGSKYRIPFILLFIIMLTNSTNMNNYMSLDEANLNINSSSTQLQLFDVMLEPIRISGDLEFNEFASTYGLSGSGSISDPFIIENFNITNSYLPLFEISSVSYAITFRNNYFGGVSGSTYSGITLMDVSNIVIENNVFNNVYRGVHMFTVSNVDLIGNTFINSFVENNAYATATNLIFVDNEFVNSQGIVITNSHGNNFTRNTFTINDNGVDVSSLGGIRLLDSNENIIVNNTFTNAGLVLEKYSGLVHLRQNIVIGNLVNNKPIYYASNLLNTIITGSYGQVILVEFNNISIVNQHISETRNAFTLIDGIVVGFSNNEIFNNTIGLYLHTVSNLFISNNTFSDNMVGIDVFNVTDSLIGLDLKSSLSIRNIFTNNTHAIDLTSFNKINIVGNNFTTGEHGVRLKCLGCLKTQLSIGYNNFSNLAFGIDFRQYEVDNFDIGYNRFERNKHGFYIWLISDTYIYSNVFIDNLYSDLHATNIYNSRIVNNNFTIPIGGSMGVIGARWEIGISYTQLQFTGNTLLNRPIYYNENCVNPIIPDDVSQIILIGCSNVNIVNRNTLYNVKIGLSAYITINNNTFLSYFQDQPNSDLISQKYPIEVYHSNNTIISNNVVQENSLISMNLVQADQTTLNSNTLARNIYTTTTLPNSFNIDYNIDEFNTVNGKKLLYIKNQSNVNVTSPNTYGQIIISNSYNVEIANQIFHDARSIISFGTSNLNIHNNEFQNNELILRETNSIDIHDNLIENTRLYLYKVNNSAISNNHFYHQLNELYRKSVIDYDCDDNLCTTITIENNRFTDSHFARLKYGSYEDVTIKGNIIESNIDTPSTPYYPDIGSLEIEGASNLNIIDNIGIRGIYLTNTIDTLIKSNLINHAKEGISLSSTSNITVILNIIVDNLFGINTQFYSHNNKILQNNISYNSYFGILLNDHTSTTFTPSNFNYIYNNTFVENDYEAIVVYRSTGVYSIKYNDLYQNGADSSNSQQAIDLVGYCFYELNYWDEWTSPDEDADGIVDVLYEIGGLIATDDLKPRTTPNHLISAPTFITPSSGEVLSNTKEILWTDAVDSSHHIVYYALYISPDNGNTWNVLTNFNAENSFSLNTTLYTDGTDYKIKVIAIDEIGLASVGISDVFEIKNNAGSDNSNSSSINNPGNSNNPRNNPSWLPPGLTDNPQAVAAGVIGLVVIGGVTRRIRKNKP
ncbi:MAG: right-handed parallel beta-helix repeat-containing protein [Candidatus Heimdallarchaeota archaeon]|nr:right-handed parallel beta-helix repeat-containing protein [Candidatus Heimdallarchaeota archaeon]MDH5644946.1 right-handed parallel beta-helix repeat-containing protein [Candidatus Heimdallarchaeota archaeon]